MGVRIASRRKRFHIQEVQKMTIEEEKYVALLEKVNNYQERTIAEQAAEIARLQQQLRDWATRNCVISS